MTVQLLERALGRRMFRVSNGVKWWTACHDVACGTWFVMNSRNTAIDDCGRIGRQVVSACEQFEAKEIDT